MFYIVDDREHSFLRKVKDNPLFHFQHLTTGDFILFDSEEKALLVIERKTWADLSNSVKDNRINNINNLVQYRKKTGAQIAYLMEGEVPADPETLISGIPYRKLRSHLDHAIICDGIIEITTRSIQDTIRRLTELAINSETIKKSRWRTFEDGLEYKENAIDLSQAMSAPKSVDFHIEKVWCSVPNISEVTARALCAKDFRVRDLFIGKLGENELGNFQTGATSRKFGLTRATKVFLNLNDKKTQIGILKSIPLISVKRAEQILQIANLREIILEWDKYETLICQSTGRAVVNKIKMLL